jgi:2-polyprenyl-6-methoxyphenol hydroxylase-like FAD-dependent oxidoreductase
MGNEVSLVELARTRPREERLTLLRELVAEFAGPDGLTVVPTPHGRSVWGYTPPPAGWRPPALTPEERAELQRRLDTPDDCMTDDELTDLFRRAAPEPDPRP